jgi:polyhydroxyalkanoate synthesis repressor PhaR
MQSKKAQASTGTRVIKKYPNRRLYDTAASAYITLADVKQFVMKREAFQVLDAKTGDDLTRSILLQIILEEEANGSPMFSSEALSNIIRFYGNTMQGFMGGYIEKGIGAALDMQAKLGEQAGKFTPEMWTQFMAGQASANPLLQGMEQSRAMFTQMQEQMLQAWGLKK